MSFKSYLKPILSCKHAELKLADASAGLLDGCIGSLVENLTSDASTYAGVAKRKTIMAKDVEIAVRTSLKHEMKGLNTLLAAAASALEAYRCKADEKKSRSGRANLALPISRIEASMRRIASPFRLSDDVGVFATAVAEIAVSDVLDLAGALAKEDGKKIVSQTHVAEALEKTAWKSLMTSKSLPLPGVGDAGQAAGDT